MDQKILKQLQKILQKELANLVTKDDAKKFATKDDLKSFATKDDLKSFATRDDLKNFATRDDLKSFATKDDLLKLKTDLIEEIKESETFIVNSVDKNKADKQVVEALEKRLTLIERKLTA